jgi:rubrerythrin
MSEKFTASEIAEMGVQIEKNGHAFYTELARTTNNDDTRQIFNFLADEEKNHIVAFQKIHDSVQVYESEELYPDEYFAYMKDLAADHVFTKFGSGLAKAQAINSDLQAIALALRFENESIKFFEEMKKMVSSEDQSIIDSLILQERRHVEKLNLLKSTY